MIDTVARRGGELFDSGLYCAESVLQAIAESKSIKSDLIPKIATGFCSGAARTCRTCGAVSGGVMAISLFFGRRSPSDSVEQIYAIVQKFLDAFEDKFGSTNCKELTGCDLGTDEGQKFFEENKIVIKCHDYTVEATRIALSLIEQNLQH
jgi:C_GCAxxG_C_C family probable redox protein